MIMSDLFGRGITWMRLHLQQGLDRPARNVDLRPAEKVYTLLTGLAICATMTAAVRWEAAWLLAALGCLIVVLIGNASMLRWYA